MLGDGTRRVSGMGIGDLTRLVPGTGLYMVKGLSLTSSLTGDWTGDG